MDITKHAGIIASPVMVIGHASLQTAVHALNNGASAYITKPLNMNEVLARVRDAVEKQHLVIETR